MLSYPDMLTTIASAERAVMNIAICAAGTVALLWLITRYTPRLLRYAHWALVVALIGLFLVSLRSVPQ